LRSGIRQEAIVMRKRTKHRGGRPVLGSTATAETRTRPKFANTRVFS